VAEIKKLFSSRKKRSSKTGKKNSQLFPDGIVGKEKRALKRGSPA